MNTPINEVGEEREASTATTKKARKELETPQYIVVDFTNEPRLHICDGVDWHNKTLSFVKKDAHGNKRVMALGGGCIVTELLTTEDDPKRQEEIQYLCALLTTEHNRYAIK